MRNGTVTIINTTPYKKQPVPEVSKEYHTFDDGKIKPSRHSTVIITDVIPFFECVNDMLISLWEYEVADCYWLYAKETDYFVEAKLIEELEDKLPLYFVRTKDGGWFSLGPLAYRLDADSSLFNKMLEEFGEDCFEK